MFIFLRTFLYRTFFKFQNGLSQVIVVCNHFARLSVCPLVSVCISFTRDHNKIRSLQFCIMPRGGGGGGGGNSTLIRRVCATDVLNLSPCSGVGKPKKDTLLWSYHSFLIYCIVFCCIVLCCIVLYCIVLYCIVLY